MSCLKISYSTKRGEREYIRKIINKNTIKRITTAKLLDLPFKEIDPDKDKRWNAKKINAEMLQAIERGESIRDMSKRLERVTDMDKNAAIRNARTMTTSFENLGRLDGMKAMKEDGTILKKQWLATISTKKHKTRDWHKELSGQIAEIDEPFINHPPNGKNGKDSEEIMYPGDPNASAANIYNCRCTLLTVVEGFEPTLPKGTVRITNDTGAESSIAKLPHGYVYLDAKEKVTKVKLRANRKDDIQYYAPDNKYKKAIASSTIATKDNIGYYAQHNKNLNVRQLYERYPEYDADAWRVLKSYMNKGYGDYKAYKLFDYGMSEDELIGNIKGYKQGIENSYGKGYKKLKVNKIWDL